GSLALAVRVMVKGAIPEDLSTEISVTLGERLPALKSIRASPAFSFLENQPLPYSRRYSLPSGPTSISMRELNWLLGMKGSILTKSPCSFMVTTLIQPRIHS